MTEWNFWVEDSDRSWGWSNHVFTFGLCFSGYGETADEALAEAKKSQRDDFKSYYETHAEELFEEEDHCFTAIRIDAEIRVTLTIKPE